MVPLLKVFNRTTHITEWSSCRITVNIKPGRRINNYILKNAVTEAFNHYVRTLIKIHSRSKITLNVNLISPTDCPDNILKNTHLSKHKHT